MIVIPNMEMPKSCWDCELLSSCKAMPKNPTADEIGIYTVMRLKDCPLIEIVRCGECKHRDSEFCQIRESMYGVKDDDFCSYGERK